MKNKFIDQTLNNNWFELNFKFNMHVKNIKKYDSANKIYNYVRLKF